MSQYVHAKSVSLLVVMTLLSPTGGQFALSQQTKPKVRAQKRRSVVRAQIMVIKTASSLEMRGLRRVEDYIPSHVVALRSPLIVKAAISRHNLKTLRSLKKGDAVRRIVRHLQVKREPKARNVLTLTYDTADAKEGAKILNAVITSYQHFLEETYRDVSKHTNRVVEKAFGQVEEEYFRKKKAYDDFLQENIEKLVGMSEVGNVKAYEKQILEWQLAEKTLQADRKWVKALGSDNLSVRLVAKRWAKEAGYKFTRDTTDLVKVYVDYLDAEALKMRLRIETLTTAKAKVARGIAELRQFQVKAERLREVVEHAKELRKQLATKLRGLNTAGQGTRYEIRVLAEPGKLVEGE
ncbi:MAG: hypothetical protein ACFCD0_23380 [Gemmataceae bacterium]